MEILDGSNQ
jgi:hypothetical protein